MSRVEIPKENSSLISFVDYSDDLSLTIGFREYYMDKITYYDVPQEIIIGMINAKSLGKFYLSHIKNKFKTTRKIMADKIIKVRIDVKKVNKDWLFQGEKGTYLDFTVLYNEKDDQYGNCGMVVQDVPKSVYENEKHLPKANQTRGDILGNAKEFKKEVLKEAMPGSTDGMKAPSENDLDDLPF